MVSTNVKHLALSLLLVSLSALPGNCQTSSPISDPPAALTIHGPIDITNAPYDPTKDLHPFQPGVFRVEKDVPVAVKTKEQQIEQTKQRDKRLDREYKDLKNKPKWVLHPIKRTDLYIDYHQNQYRKFRTRVLPAAQFVGVMVGMGFSVASAL